MLNVQVFDDRLIFLTGGFFLREISFINKSIYFTLDYKI